MGAPRKVFMRSWRTAVVAGGAVIVAATSATALAQLGVAPSCVTMNAQRQPATRFASGEEVVVRGTGFGSQSIVLVSFEQGSRTADIARVKTNDLGAFTTPAGTRIPDVIQDGQASLRAIDAHGSASCPLTLVAAQILGAKHFPKGAYIAWLAALVVGGLLLGAAGYRHRQARRLREEMEGIGRRRPPAEERALPLLLDDMDEEDEEYGELDDDEEGNDLADEIVFVDDVPQLVMPDDDALALDLNGNGVEPDDAHAGRAPSEAVARLRREVLTWRR